MEKRNITNDEIESAKTPSGGWTKASLEQWGVPWPPPKGWRAEILRNGIPYSQAETQTDAHKRQSQNGGD